MESGPQVTATPPPSRCDVCKTYKLVAPVKLAATSLLLCNYCTAMMLEMLVQRITAETE